MEPDNVAPADIGGVSQTQLAYIGNTLQSTAEPSLNQGEPVPILDFQVFVNGVVELNIECSELQPYD